MVQDADDWRLTQAQVSAADELSNKLCNWRFADRCFTFLKNQHFASEEVCLLMVVAIDSLYSTSLRYTPGLREKIARYVYSNRETLLRATDITPGLAEEIAGLGPKNEISFASKFCHFFLSENYPIYDSFVCVALKKQIPKRVRRRHKIKFKRYSDFCDVCSRMTELTNSAGKITMRQLDQCLWLMGQLLEQDKSSSRLDGAEQSNETQNQNEVRAIFANCPDLAGKLLPIGRNDLA